MQSLESKSDKCQHTKAFTSKWVDAFAVIKFDIDEGQKIDFIRPNKNLSETEEKQIAMLSFPDSNSLGDYEGTFKYVFKLKNECYGYTCFRQKKDPQNPRGYSQKSLVVLSFLPFTNFFLKMSEFIVFKTFRSTDFIEESLQKILNQIADWPDPTPLSQCVLPVLDYEMSIQVPNYLINYREQIDIGKTNIEIKNESQFSIEQIVSKQSLQRAGRFQQIRLTQTFDNCLESLWYLWEATLLNQKILVIGSNPYTVSQAVLGAISLTNPIHYHGQFSPYATVFDPNLKHYQQDSESFIIGASNPLFLKLFTQKDICIVNLNEREKTKSPHFSKSTIVPVSELLIESKNEEQRAINESSLRKYFYRLNNSIISLVEAYVKQQTNDMKFFNMKEFISFLKNTKGIQHLENLFERKKHLLAFFEKLSQSINFKMFLKSRNIYNHKGSY